MKKNKKSKEKCSLKHTPLSWIFERSKSQRFKMCALIISNAIFSALSVLFAFAIKEIIDSATVHNNVNRLISYSVAIGIIVILQFVFRIVINGLSEHIRGKLEMDYKKHVFSSILTKRQEKITDYHSGELMNRLTSDVAVVADGASSILPTVVSATVRLGCAVVAIVILDWIFAIAFTIAGLLVFLTISLLRGKLKSLHKKTQETDGRVRSFMQECIENLLAVKVFSVNDKIEKKSTKLQQENFEVKMLRRNYSVVGSATYNFIFSAGYLFALIYGGVKLLTGSGLTYGGLSAILQLVNNIQVPFATLSNVMPKYYAMIASTERLMEIEEIQNENPIKPFDKQKIYSSMQSICFDKVCFAYDRDNVLKDANFTINKGDFVLIEGTSGIGKSTLIKLMLGVYSLESGQIYIKTENEKIELDNSTRSLFSYVPQGNLIFSGTIEDNVRFIREDATDEEVERALKISCADKFIYDLPLGLKTVIGENGVGLSEGQVQRLAIARAILCSAPIILLDEATSALDENTERCLLDNLKGLEGVTLVVVSHKKSALSICNRKIKIDKKGVAEL